MPKLIPPSESLIAMAAFMRAAGESWEAIGREVGRSASRVRHWPRDYPIEWTRHFRDAETNMFAELATEARFAARKLLRSPSEKTQISVAVPLLKLRQAEREREFRRDQSSPAPPNVEPRDDDVEIAAFVRELKEMTDEELDESIREFVANDSQLSSAGDGPDIPSE